MKFAKQMFEIEEVLKNNGHEVYIPKHSERFTGDDSLKNDIQFLIRGDYMQNHFEKIEKSEAILVLNYQKNKIDNYIGGNTLMEMGIAKYLGKKIYLYNNIPSKDVLSYSTEIEAVEPIVINNNLELIK